MQPQLCKNCEHTFHGNYCSNCGQKTNTVRLNWNYIQDELKYTFLHINKGFLYTIKELFTRPGDTVREFLEGKRVHHYKPILLLFVLAGINGVLSLYINLTSYIPKTKGANQFADEMPKMMNWIFSHYTLVELSLLPLFSLCSWLSFKKYGYNYIENIIINCFASAQRLALGIITFPILYFSSPKYTMIISSLMALPLYGLTVWLYLQLYKKHNPGSVILRLLLFGFLATMIFFFVIIVATFIYIFYLIKTGQVQIH